MKNEFEQANSSLEEGPVEERGGLGPQDTGLSWQEKLIKLATTREFLIGGYAGLSLGMIIGATLIITIAVAATHQATGIAFIILLALIGYNIYLVVSSHRFRKRHQKLPPQEHP